MGQAWKGARLVGSAEAVVGAFPNPVVLLDRAGRVRSLNEGAEGLIGRGALGQHHVSVLRQPRLLDAVEEALAGRPGGAPFVSQDAGRDVAWHVAARPVEGGGTLLVFEDRSLGDEIGQVRRDFVANVSHELKTPITALAGYIETLRGPAREDPAARERFLASMARETDRMSRLVSDLLSLSRVEAEGRSRPRGKVDLSSLARQVRRTFVERQDSGTERISLEAPERALVIGDRDQLEQVVANLLENALRYAPNGAIILRVSEPRDEPSVRGQGIRLSVSDEGPGIAAHHLPRLTERFYRVDGHRSREMGGTGLGLSIVKHIVARHRGRFSIESEIGAGSTFSMILPSAEA